MTKILLLSDTHSYIDETILNFCRQADEVWHAGDIGTHEVTDKLASASKLRAVHGNIDDTNIRVSYPKDQRFLCEEVDVWMTHIGGYPGRYSAQIKETLEINPPKIFICGHSHILKVIQDKKYGLLHMNPGAAGIYGFHKVRTMLRFEIQGADIKNLELIELETR